MNSNSASIYGTRVHKNHALPSIFFSNRTAFLLFTRIKSEESIELFKKSPWNPESASAPAGLICSGNVTKLKAEIGFKHEGE